MSIIPENAPDRNGGVQSYFAVTSSEYPDDKVFNGFVGSLSDMMEATIPPREEIILGLGRGEVGMLVSVTNVGKTTLTLNTCLSLAAGEKCNPLVPDPQKPLKVLYLDFETPAGQFRDYARTMLQQLRDPGPTGTNFIAVVDKTISDEDLNLSNEKHRAEVESIIAKHMPDLIVIDTVAAAFNINDENSNAEVGKVIKKLRRMAKKANAAMLVIHHQGKPGESHNREEAYAGRGASSWGSLPRTVLTLRKDESKGPGYVVLRCAKIKGRPFDPLLLKLDRDKAWFEICAEKPNPNNERLTATEIEAFLNENGETQRKAIIEHFKGRVSEKTIDRVLRQGCKAGIIDKPREGYYRIP